ncbi:MAG: hypothetical protein Q9166_007071 [cf. Caloplaca sp. 2 TL-2023]
MSYFEAQLHYMERLEKLIKELQGSDLVAESAAGQDSVHLVILAQNALKKTLEAKDAFEPSRVKVQELSERDKRLGKQESELATKTEALRLDRERLFKQESELSRRAEALRVYQDRYNKSLDTERDAIAKQEARLSQKQEGYELAIQKLGEREGQLAVREAIVLDKEREMVQRQGQIQIQLNRQTELTRKLEASLQKLEIGVPHLHELAAASTTASKNNSEVAATAQELRDLVNRQDQVTHKLEAWMEKLSFAAKENENLEGKFLETAADILKMQKDNINQRGSHWLDVIELAKHVDQRAKSVENSIDGTLATIERFEDRRKSGINKTQKALLIQTNRVNELMKTVNSTATAIETLEQYVGTAK